MLTFGGKKKGGVPHTVSLSLPREPKDVYKYPTVGKVKLCGHFY